MPDIHLQACVQLLFSAAVSDERCTNDTLMFIVACRRYCNGEKFCFFGIIQSMSGGNRPSRLLGMKYWSATVKRV